MEITDLATSILEAEKALAAVEKNGVEYIHLQERSYPCGGCQTYQKAVHQALRILRSLDLDAIEDRVAGKS